jgi:hypothetical protein
MKNFLGDIHQFLATGHHQWIGTLKKNAISSLCLLSCEKLFQNGKKLKIKQRFYIILCLHDEEIIKYTTMQKLGKRADDNSLSMDFNFSNNKYFC